MLQSMGSQRVGHDLATEQQHVLLCLPGCSVVKDPPANAGDTGWIPGLGRSPREGNGHSLQYSCLENLMDRQPGRLQSMGSQRIEPEHAHTHTHTHTHIITAAAAAKSLQSVRLCATPQTAAHQAPPSLGFSRQEHWSGLPFPSPMHESEK